MHLTLASPRALPTGAIIIFLLTPDAVNWSRFAYTQYVTNTAYLCNSVMLFETLHRLGSKAERLMIYPERFSIDEQDSPSESRLLRKAREEFGVRLVPVKVQSRDGDDPTWAESYTKLLAFNQTQYEPNGRTLPPLPPPCPVAMPRAYWLNPADRTLSSQLLLIQPSTFEFNRVMTAMSNAGSSDYDMEIVNDLYRDSALILPHRPYDLLTGEFRSKKHTAYLRNDVESWDPEGPWVSASSDAVQAEQPSCDVNSTTGQEEDCRARDLWLVFNADFAARRKVGVMFSLA
ncbi:hypothetical protein BDV19DRAFT_381768 [Aspergillus venezuelensis]